MEAAWGVARPSWGLGRGIGSPPPMERKGRLGDSPRQDSGTQVSCGRQFGQNFSWGPVAAKPAISLPLLGRLHPAPSAAAPVSPPGFSVLAEPPPASPPPSAPICARCGAGAAEPFLLHCESRNELEASRASELLLGRGAGGLLLATTETLL